MNARYCLSCHGSGLFSSKKKLKYYNTNELVLAKCSYSKALVAFSLVQLKTTFELSGSLYPYLNLNSTLPVFIETHKVGGLGPLLSKKYAQLTLLVETFYF